jgi:hypothetical protein
MELNLSRTDSIIRPWLSEAVPPGAGLAGDGVAAAR